MADVLRRVRAVKKPRFCTFLTIKNAVIRASGTLVIEGSNVSVMTLPD